MIIDKKLIEILKLKNSINIETEFLKEHPEKEQSSGMRIMFLHSKIAKILTS